MTDNGLISPQHVRLAALHLTDASPKHANDAADLFMKVLGEIADGSFKVCLHCGLGAMPDDAYSGPCHACQRRMCPCEDIYEDWSDEKLMFCNDCASVCECVESVHCDQCKRKHVGEAGLIDTNPHRQFNRHDSPNDPGDQWAECPKCEGTPGVELTHAGRVEMERNEAAGLQALADTLREVEADV